MPPRRHTNSSSSISKAAGCFSPDASVASYKDVLLFEERLKQNAALLRSRKRKYEGELLVLAPPSCLASSYEREEETRKELSKLS
jgi:hypothetical protein